METKVICICGGGSLGHVIAGYIAANNFAKVNILTRRPNSWGNELQTILPDGKRIVGKLNKVSYQPEHVIPESDIVLLCMPGYAIPHELDIIAPYLGKGTKVGTVFSSTGFFQEAFNRLPKDIILWGLQRVPYVARVSEYGHVSNLLGYRDMLHLAVERDENPIEFANLISKWLNEPVTLLNSWMEAAITNSNPLLHTSRLFTMFHDWEFGMAYPRQILFYQEWTDEASFTLAEMDKELFQLISKLPVTKGYLDPILTHYDSDTPQQMTAKIRSISGLRGILTPMKETSDGWIPDFGSRYFTEDFPYGLRYIHDLCHSYGVPCPVIDKVYNWGLKFIQ